MSRGLPHSSWWHKLFPACLLNGVLARNVTVTRFKLKWVTAGGVLLNSNPFPGQSSVTEHPAQRPGATASACMRDTFHRSGGTGRPGVLSRSGGRSGHLNNGRKQACFCFLGLWQPSKASAPITPPAARTSLPRITRTPEGPLFPGRRATALAPRAQPACAFPCLVTVISSTHPKDDLFL